MSIRGMVMDGVESWTGYNTFSDLESLTLADLSDS